MYRWRLMCGVSLVAVSTFLAERLELGDPFEVFRAARGAFEPDERLEVDEPACNAEDLARLGMRQQRLVAAAARHFPE